MGHTVKIDTSKDQCLNRVTINENSEVYSSRDIGEENKLDIDSVDCRYEDRLSIPEQPVIISNTGINGGINVEIVGTPEGGVPIKTDEEVLSVYNCMLKELHKLNLQHAIITDNYVTNEDIEV